LAIGEWPKPVTTFVETRLFKSPPRSPYQRFCLPLLIDSGLAVEMALGGAPRGFISAPLPADNATDKDNINKLLSDLKRRKPEGQRPGTFFMCFGLFASCR